MSEYLKLIKEKTIELQKLDDEKKAALKEEQLDHSDDMRIINHIEYYYNKMKELEAEKKNPIDVLKELNKEKRRTIKDSLFVLAISLSTQIGLILSSGFPINLAIILGNMLFISTVATIYYKTKEKSTIKNNSKDIDSEIVECKRNFDNYIDERISKKQNSIDIRKKLEDIHNRIAVANKELSTLNEIVKSALKEVLDNPTVIQLLEEKIETKCEDINPQLVKSLDQTKSSLN